MKRRKILIVGGVAGGASAATRLRRLDEQAEIIMFEKGEYISYASCGFPYYIGGEIEALSRLIVQTPENFQKSLAVDVRMFSEVIKIDRAAKKIVVQNHKTGEQYEEDYDSLILAPGARPVMPPIPGIDSKRVFTLRTVPDADAIKKFIEKEKPATVAVVGGGYIGVEMAENLHRAGLSVTIVEMQNQLVAPLDYDMACEVHRMIRSKGVKILLETAVSAIHDTGEGLRIEYTGGTLSADMLLLSIGVTPDSGLGKEAGLTLNERGSIVVDEHMQTSDENIYAVGDVIQVTDFVTGQPAFVPLAGPAGKQGRIAADNICGIPSRYTGTQGSAVAKVFDLTVATTGINEKTASRLNLPYDKTFVFASNHASYFPGAQMLTIKVVFEEGSGKILGAQIVGKEGCDKRSDVMATAIRFGATAKDLEELELGYAPPYSSPKDPVNVVGQVIQNVLDGDVKQFHWHEVDDLPRNGEAILLDVRAVSEYEKGHVDGFTRVSLGTLREMSETFDVSKPVYLMCEAGVRAYMASRILRQRGFVCYTLSGGYRLYRRILEDKRAQKDQKTL